MRFLGETDFAKGEWCGVELDEPLGKNDGAVAGTRSVHPHIYSGIFLWILFWVFISSMEFSIRGGSKAAGGEGWSTLV